jgi:hypothetical protein
MKPKYTHDCEACKFLGHYDAHDMYYCEQAGLIPTVVCRYGDDGHDYTSGLEFAELSPPIAIAKHLAVKAGYIA